MARTKQAARRNKKLREQEAALREDRTPAALTMLGGTLPDINALEEDDDESMNLDGSDRFSIDLNYPAPTSPDPDVDGANKTSELQQQCLQKPVETLSQTENLWQQPPPNDLGKRSRKGIHQVYYRTCRLIFRHWQCDISDCIPEELRKRTPYSLAILTQLRILASQTTGDRAAAHDMLLRIARERIGGLEMWEPDPDRPYFVETHPQIVQQCVERAIQENVFGLMMEDVQNALREINNEPNPDRPARKNGLAGQGRSSEEGTGGVLTPKGVKKSRIEKREAKAAKKAARQKIRGQKVEVRQLRKQQKEQERNRFALYEPPATQSHSPATAPPNSTVTQISNKFSALSDQFTISTDTHSHNIRAPKLPHAEATEELSQRDKENYAGMARLMTKMGVKSSKPSGKQRLARLTTGGLSRRPGVGKRSLPFERTDLGNMSALNIPNSRARPQELAQMDSLAIDDVPD